VREERLVPIDVLDDPEQVQGMGPDDLPLHVPLRDRRHQEAGGFEEHVVMIIVLYRPRVVVVGTVFFGCIFCILF